MEPEGAEQPAWCVVPDTNAWVNDFGLRSAAGAALIHTLQLQQGVIGLPEVVESELLSKLTERGSKAAADTNRSLNEIQLIRGSRPKLYIPTEDDFRDSVTNWLSQINDLLLRVPINEDAAREAVEMAIAKKAPNHKREEIRDSMIFLACLDIAEEHRVVLVTNDGDFFDGDTFHPQLYEAADERGVKIEVDRSIRDCLVRIGAKKPGLVDEELVVHALSRAISNDLAEEASQYGFGLGEMEHSVLKFYATEDPQHLAVTFELTLTLEKDEMSPEEARLVGQSVLAPYLSEYADVVVVGSARYRAETATIPSYSIDSTRYTSYDEAGGEVSFTVNRMSATSGGRQIPLTQRYRLGWDSGSF